MIRIWILVFAVGCQSVCAQESKLLRSAEVVLLYQRDSGGWPKNYNRDAKLSQRDKTKLLDAKSNTDSTIDNGATHREIRLLAKAYRESADQRYRDAAIRGIEYLLKAQYDNGGWPQYYPLRDNYSRYITFNDGAMVGVLDLLCDIRDRSNDFAFVDDQRRTRCKSAIERGIECILRCQIKVDGQPMVWCAQHDEKTLKPEKARSYELATFSGGESVGIVRFLMKIDRPNDEVKQSIEAALDWFEASKLEGIRLDKVKDKSLPGGSDRVIVKDSNAKPLWGRFYDIKSNRPIFCSRDGIPRSSIAEISHERRNGYSWLVSSPRDLLEKDAPRWREKTK